MKPIPGKCDMSLNAGIRHHQEDHLSRDHFGIITRKECDQRARCSGFRAS
jgi:hypothetical protein